MADDLRARIDAALQQSIDRCARCKACDAQVDAVMAVIAGLAQLPEGTVTEWGVRFDGPPPFHSEMSAYDTEAEARHQAAVIPTKVGGWSATLMSHQVTPWTEVPEPRKDDDHE
jgi:hypothetical protein